MDPEDVLDSYAYNNYLDDRSYFYSNDTSMDSITINDTSYYSCYSNSNVYYNYDNDDFYLYDEDAYSEAYDDYYAAGNRDDLRDALKDLELLTLLFVDGYRQIDVARLWHCSRSAVAQRFKKIKKFLNNT